MTVFTVVLPGYAYPLLLAVAIVPFCSAENILRHGNHDHNDPEHHHHHNDLEWTPPSSVDNDVHDGLIDAIVSEQEEETIEVVHRDWVIGKLLKDYTVPTHSLDSWKLSKEATISPVKGVTLIKDDNASPAYMSSAKPLPQAFFNYGVADWEIKTTFKFITGDGPSEENHPGHDAAIILASKNAIDELKDSKFQLDTKIKSEAIAVLLQARRRDNNTVLTMRTERLDTTGVFFFSGDRQIVCQTVYKSTSSKALLKARISIRKSSMFSALNVEMLQQTGCFLEYHPGFFNTKDFYMAIAANPKHSLDEFTVSSLKASLQNVTTKGYTDVYKDPFDDFPNYLNNGSVIDKVGGKIIVAPDYDDYFDGGVSKKPKPSPSLNAPTPSFKYFDVRDEATYRSSIFNKFSLDSPNISANWQASGYVEIKNNKLVFNKKENDQRYGIVLSKSSLPLGNSSWRIDANFSVDSTSSQHSYAEMTLWLITENGAQTLSSIIDYEAKEVIKVFESDTFSKERYLSAVFAGVFLTMENSIMLLASKNLHDSTGDRLRHCTTVQKRGSVNISVIKDLATSITVAIEWTSYGEDFSTCKVFTTFAKEQWPFPDIDSVKLVMMFPPLQHPDDKSTMAKLELGQVRASPLISVQAAGDKNLPPVFAMSTCVNKEDCGSIEVPVCDSLSGSFPSGCPLDCSTRNGEPTSLVVWLKTPANAGDKLLRIDGAAGIPVLHLANLGGDVMVGDRFTCIVRNEYGSATRSFVVVASRQTGLQGWEGVLLYFGGLFTAVLLAAGYFLFIFARRWTMRMSGNNNAVDHYSLLHRP